MSIIADKKNGKLTGRFRVQLMVNYELVRCRVDSLREATLLEAEWKAAKVEGRALLMPERAARKPVEAFQVPMATPVLAPSLKLSDARRKAEGRIWQGYTENNNMNHLKVIERLMGDVELNAIDDPWVMDLQAKLREERECSDGTVNRYSSTLSRFLKWAVKANHRTVKDLPDFEFRKESEGRIRWFTPEEETALLKLLPERTAKLVRFAILTGGRRGELLATKPEAVFPDRVIFWGEGTKSGKSRPVLLTDEGRKLAQWLFVEGNKPTAQMLRQDWAKARTTLGMDADPEFVFHGCRHTFAVRAVDAAVPIRTLQSWMGHETIEMTERYAKVSGKALENAKELMFAVAA